jgi:hypothetical protein
MLNKVQLCSHLGQRAGPPDTILEKDHPMTILIKVWFQLSDWFQTRRFLCEFPIGSYVKLSSAVGAILVEGPNRPTHFWKRTIQWLFHQNFVLIEQMVSDKKIFMGLSHRVLCSCNNVAPVTNLCLGRATTRFHSSQWSKQKVEVET